MPVKKILFLLPPPQFLFKLSLNVERWLKNSIYTIIENLSKCKCIEFAVLCLSNDCML